MNKPSSVSRPLSPHLQIYRVQLTSLMSIIHRVTGAGLLIVLHGWVAWLWIVGFCPDAYTVMQEVARYRAAQPLIWIGVWSLAYHAWNGLRHMMWDWGYGLSLTSVYTTGYIVWGLSLISTLALWWWS